MYRFVSTTLSSASRMTSGASNESLPPLATNPGASAGASAAWKRSRGVSSSGAVQAEGFSSVATLLQEFTGNYERLSLSVLFLFKYFTHKTVQAL
jgi:hypothetical protein